MFVLVLQGRRRHRAPSMELCHSKQARVSFLIKTKLIFIFDFNGGAAWLAGISSRLTASQVQGSSLKSVTRGNICDSNQENEEIGLFHSLRVVSLERESLVIESPKRQNCTLF